ncbi:MAG TPA: hypothetical protein VGN63_15345 [Flavisolibacter sp.]|jgi:hypothetical protein|nr:hypothetical protein [Flavisolibacter sp.]
MPHAKSRWTIVLFLFALLTACKKNPVTPSAIDLSRVLLENFQLEETGYAGISLTHPIINNGVETQQGEIRVTVPRGTVLTSLTPKPSNFTNNDFTVNPQLGRPQNFQNRVQVYSIASKQDASKRVHYAVTITEAPPEPDPEAALTSFTFEKAKNPFLPADVEAARIIEGVGTIGKVFVFVPAGTSFSSLTPTIGFSGTALYYMQDAAGVPENSTTVYPSAGLPIDFTYPKVFYAVVKSGTTVKTYNVIVDVKAPIHFDNTTATTADVAVGAVRFIQATTFQNRGNHPITIASVAHTDHVPAGIQVIRGSGAAPNGGVLSNNRGEVFATISAQTFSAGSYEVTASFKPRLVNHREADDLLESTSLRIKSTIVE